VPADLLEEQLVGRQIATMGDAAEDFGVLGVVEVVLVGIEHAVTAEPVRLVELEIKANRWHASFPASDVGRAATGAEAAWRDINGSDCTEKNREANLYNFRPPGEIRLKPAGESVN
jgi:hypothetical protein